MRIAWLLILLLAAPLAAAQTTTQARPSLVLDPAVLDVAPGGQAVTHAVVRNTLDHDLVFNVTAHPADGVKARVDKPLLRVPAGATESVLVTVLVPNVTNVTYIVEVAAKEANGTRPSATATNAPIVLGAKLELRVPPARPLAAPKPQPILPPVQFRIEPRVVDLPANGTASATVFVTNLGHAAIPMDLEVLAPGAIAADIEGRPNVLEPGKTATLRLVLHDLGGGPRGPLLLSIRMPAFDRARGDLEVRVVEPPLIGSGVDPQIVTVAAVAAGAAGVWSAAWLTRRDWWPLLLALYTRLRPSKILDHPVRRRIAELVQQHPGVSFGDLARLAGIAPGQLTHHARMLEKAGVVFSSPDGQTRRFFHVGAGRLASVPPLSQRALDLVRERPRRMSDLAKELNVSRQSLHYHVKHLVAEGKLVARVDGREMWLEVPAAVTART